MDPQPGRLEAAGGSSEDLPEDPPADPAEDPRLACVRDLLAAPHPGHASLEPSLRAAVVRSLCAEVHDLRGVSASVAIVQEDEVVFAAAVGPRCRGQPERLRSSTPLRIGSITKLVTAALALAEAQRQGVGLDEPLAALSELQPPPSLRELLTHTSGLRDPEPHELLSRGDRWALALALHREAPGAHAYANANFLLVGAWLERVTGRELTSRLETEPTLAAVRERIALAMDDGARLACDHREGWGWQAIEASASPPLPAWTRAAGGGLASAEDLARLPFALERSGWLPAMTSTRVISDRPGWDYGLGIRMQGTGDALVLGHSGNTGTHWAELQWSPRHRVAVAVLSSTPQAYKATLHAAFTAALALQPQGP
ncbi:serine hydrolase domain-containing protein [Paraliomyxa miuraensis]|uniref:serine hydrolase domain-containing protein n=1 Tax=Paraliomyxa miuraensis TaxID=376150 RepID=UPI00225449F0|nr:serine hydrolase domain-containing protein [Paraliomyxa miuraensis]MCX4241159.1 beta-lactamase family protein [Paraliomyxa miuraensis]